MKQFSNVIKTAVPLLLLLFVFSCSPQMSVSVIVPESYFADKQNQMYLYLLTEDEYANIQDIKQRNNEYFRKKISVISDSLSVLQATYNSIYNELTVTSANCSTLTQRLPIEYCSKVTATPTSISKYGDVWQLSVSINNNGNEDIWGLVMSIKFRDAVIINRKKYSLFIQPGQRYLFNKINFDLGNNIPLQYSMATYPGGLNKMLQEALTVEIDSVISMFSISLADCQEKTVLLEQDLDAAGIAIDVYLEQMAEYLEAVLIKPVNLIIEDNLSRAEYSANLSSPDTLTFNGLKKGVYKLFAYSDIKADSIQYLIPVDLSQIEQATINLNYYQPDFLFLNKDNFLKRIPVFQFP